MKKIESKSNGLGLYVVIVILLLILGSYISGISSPIHMKTNQFLGTYSSKESQNKDMRMVIFPTEDNCAITFYDFDPKNYSSESGTYEKIDSKTYLITFEELGEQTIIHDDKSFNFTINGDEITFVKDRDSRFIIK